MTEAAASAPPVEASRAALRRIIAAAWLAVLAGFSVQALAAAFKHTAGANFVPPVFIADIVQGMSWSLLVCGAIALGTIVGKARVATAGMIGLVAGPVAWAAAKGAQKSMQALLGAPEDQLTTFFWMLCIIKGLEYAVLGGALARLVQTPWAKLSTHIAVGLIIGIVGAGVVVSLNLANAQATGAPFPPPKLAATTVNELVFPVACSVVIYLAQQITRHVGVLKAAA